MQSSGIETTHVENSLEDETLLAESRLYLNTLKECFYKEEKNKNIQDLEKKIKIQLLEIENNMKLLKEKMDKIKAILLVKERHEIVMRSAKKLEGLPDEIESEMFDKNKEIMQELEQIKSPLILKKFSQVSKTETEKIVQDFKDISNTMKNIEQYIRTTEEADRSVHHLPKLVEKFRGVKDIVEKCEQEGNEVNELMMRYISLKLGTQSLN